MNEHFEATIMHETADAEKDNSRPSSAAVRWLQLKYVLIALVALAGLIFLSRSGALAGLNGLVADVTTLSSEWGLVGNFFIDPTRRTGPTYDDRMPIHLQGLQMGVKLLIDL